MGDLAVRNSSIMERVFETASEYDVIYKWAQVLAKSGMVPKAYLNEPEKIIVAIQFGQEVGFKPLQSLQSIAVINGTPAIWGKALRALVKTKPDYEYMIETVDVIGGKLVAMCKCKRIGEPEVIATFTQDDAEKAGLWGRNVWASYPKDMIGYKALKRGVDKAWPHHILGLEVVEDIREVAEQQTVQFSREPTDEEKAALKAAEVDSKMRRQMYNRVKGGVENQTLDLLAARQIAGYDVSEDSGERFSAEADESCLRAMNELIRKGEQQPAPKAITADPEPVSTIVDSPTTVNEATLNIVRGRATLTGVDAEQICKERLGKALEAITPAEATELLEYLKAL